MVFSGHQPSGLYVDNTAPSALSATGQDIYRSLIALAYSSDGNLERALQRLQLLQDADIRQALARTGTAALQISPPAGRRAPGGIVQASSKPVSIRLGLSIRRSQPNCRFRHSFCHIDPRAVSTATPVPPTATLPPTMTLRHSLYPTAYTKRPLHPGEPGGNL